MTLVPGELHVGGEAPGKQQIGQQQEDKGLLSLALAKAELFWPWAGGGMAATACRRVHWQERDCDRVIAGAWLLTPGAETEAVASELLSY